MKVVALGDVHLGSYQCNTKLLEKKIDWIKKQNNIIVVLMGDLINAGTKVSIGAGTFDDTYHPEEQYERMLDYLRPIKDKIVLAVTGNHCERIRQLTSFDVTKLLCRELGVYYAKDGSALMNVKVNKQHYTFYVKHGSTGAATSAGKMNGCIKMADYADADIYLMGHVHSLQHTLQMYRRYNRKNKMIDEVEKHFLTTGSFVDWDASYGELKGYSPMKCGMPTLSLSGSRFDVQVEM